VYYDYDYHYYTLVVLVPSVNVLVTLLTCGNHSLNTTLCMRSLFRWNQIPYFSSNWHHQR